jgi:hypothetical protein
MANVAGDLSFLPEDGKINLRGKSICQQVKSEIYQQICLGLPRNSVFLHLKRVIHETLIF